MVINWNSVYFGETVQALTQPVIVSCKLVFLEQTLILSIQLARNFEFYYWRRYIFERIYYQYKVPHTSLSQQNVPTAVTKVILRRVISHNSSQMDSPEIKSASQTASWGGNIALQFFIDLHSFSPSYFPHFAPPSLSYIALLGASPYVFDDERHNIHQVRGKSVE